MQLKSDHKKIFLLGYSGHAYVVADTLLVCGHELAGYFDQQQAAKNPFELSYFGNESTVDLKGIVQENFVFPAVGDNAVRAKLVRLIAESQSCKVISPSAYVSPYAVVQHSTLVAANASVNPFANVGKGCIINTGAVVEHECRIGDFSHIGPGAVLAGNVKVGELTFIGANAVVKQGIEIGIGVIIGAGSVVLESIPDGEVWVGNPAKKIR